MSINIPTTSNPRVVIIGGGFAGIELAKGLRNAQVQVVLIDRNNYHTFQPLLYQVATAALEPATIAYPFREIFQDQENFIFRMADVLSIKPEQNTIETSIGEISYEYLVIAVGSKTNYFGMADVEKYSCPMKTVPQAMALRNLMLENFEKALLTKDIEEQKRLMNIVVIGGGPTGVETAGALGELKLHVLPNDYPELNFRQMHIHIVDLDSRLLRNMPEDASASAEKFLRKFDVNIWLNTKVISYDGQIVKLSNGKELSSYSVIWAAGVTGALTPGLQKGSIAPGNRIKVDPVNRVEGYQNIFAVGDIACMVTEKSPKGHPMLAPVAIQQAKLLSKNLQSLLKGRPTKPFAYRDMGVLATVGRNHAVVDLNFIKFYGVFAWFVWLFVHLMALVGFRNKLVAFVNWAWNYFSYDRGLRLIIRPFIR